jgi:hypothetical protein
MMRTLTLIALLFVGRSAFAQPDTLWSRAYGTPAVEWGYAVAVTPEGDHLFTGLNNRGLNDIFVTRAGGAGNEIWSRTYEQPGSEIGQAIAATPDGGFLVAASTNTLETPGDVQIKKMDAAGDILWSRVLGGPGNERPTALLVNDDGTFVVVGFVEDPNIANAADVLIAKYSAVGDTIWVRRLLGAENEIPWAITRSDDGYLVAGGVAFSGSAVWDILAVRITEAGDEVWRQHYGDSDDEVAYGVGTIGTGFLLGGQTSVVGQGGNYYAIRIANDGNLVWTRSYASSRAETAGGAAVTTDQGIVIGGYQSTPDRASEVFLVKYSASGTLAWTLSLGGTQNDFCEGLTSTADGGIAVVGMTRSMGHGETDIYGIRLAGLAGVTGIVTNRTDGLPLAGVRLSALGQQNSSTSDRLGHYTLAIAPGVATVTVSGNCVEPDSILNVTVLQDSFHTLDISVLLPRVEFDQSSINIVAPNHGSASEPLHIGNPGEGQLYFSITPVTIQPSSNWLAVSPRFGVLDPGAQMEVMITVAADTADVGVFDFIGALTVRVNSCPDSVFHVDVTATIVNAADDERPELPRELSLAAFPNPFNPATKIEFTLPVSGLVSLWVYDLQGRAVRQLVEGQLAAGVHRINLDGTALSTGVYFAQLQTSTGTIVSKLLLLK